MDAAAITRAIERKRDGSSLAEIWPELVRQYLNGSLDDGHMGALLMACMTNSRPAASAIPRR